MDNFGFFPSVSQLVASQKAGAISVFPDNIKPYYLIGGANQIETLRIPITSQTKNSTPDQWCISYETKWVREHKNAWRTAYGKSPFYPYYDYKLEAILDLHKESFKDLHESMMNLLLPWIGLEDLRREKTFPENLNSQPEIKPYYQVFETKFGFRKGLSILDLIFNIGPEAVTYFH